ARYLRPRLLAHPYRPSDHNSSFQVYCSVSGKTTPPRPIEMKMDGARNGQMTSGWVNGFLGVLIFSGSLPATRVAVMDFDPVFLTVCRAAIAGVLAGALLLVFRQQRPVRRDIVPLLVVALGVVVGFPLLTALALQSVI